MFNSFVESSVSYGNEVWTLNKRMEDKISATEMIIGDVVARRP